MRIELYQTRLRNGVSTHAKAVAWLWSKFKPGVAIFLILLFLASHIHADLETIEGDAIDISQLHQETMFVSLGSYCAPASLARDSGLRKAAFPLDWNISMDGEKLIEMLQDGFAHFLNEKYLTPFGWACLLNTRYHLEFVHDGSWDGDNYSIYMPLFQEKYKRRIERFLQLKEYKGEVFFIRSAYIHSTEDLNRFYKLKENIEITEEYAIRLFKSLESIFNKLKFKLIVINNHEFEHIVKEKKLNNRLIMARASPWFTEPAVAKSYQEFFNELVNTEEGK